jgi:hypothetical protein
MLNSFELRLDWIRPENFVTLQELRKVLQQALVARIEPEVHAVWATEVPEAGQPLLKKQVASGVRRGLNALTLTPKSEQFKANIWLNLTAIPAYWEAPVSSLPEPPCFGPSAPGIPVGLRCASLRHS